MKVLRTFYTDSVSVLLLWEPRDLWIGAYVKGSYIEPPSRVVEVYICIVPMFPLRICYYRPMKI